ncbi:MAPEG family protein [Gloeocapsa sp. PCC 73106]|uniref:MAPEG family protein n=1 Tax=Gloeocapsa sp. PCC 73106 TaxID=102232 RepID=UPI0002AC1C8C|nr:MAPEG family protein [Gloeocapsa sp. PCC 73106]ELR97016.1 putative MAPEG superfamily protein [Gloeocapsa sp. PCC 73106]
MLLEPSIITVLTLIVYFVITLNVGRARFKYGVKPPATTGDPNFERALRVQQNTLEQLVFFLPLLWIFSYYISPRWGLILGAIWLVGRILYAWGYYQAPEKRGPGFAISSLASLALLVGAIAGLVLSARQLFNVT